MTGTRNQLEMQITTNTGTGQTGDRQRGEEALTIEPSALAWALHTPAWSPEGGEHFR